MMKKFLAAVFALLVSNIGLAKNLETVIAEIEKDSLAVVMFMNHDMIMSKLGSHDGNLTELLKDVEDVKVLMNDGEDIGKLNAFKNKISELDTSNMETIVKVADKEDKVNIYAKTENEQIKDIIILVDSDDTAVMVIMSGKINRDVLVRMLESGMIKIS